MRTSVRSWLNSFTTGHSSIFMAGAQGTKLDAKRAKKSLADLQHARKPGTLWARRIGHGSTAPERF